MLIGRSVDSYPGRAQPADSHKGYAAIWYYAMSVGRRTSPFEETATAVRGYGAGVADAVALIRARASSIAALSGASGAEFAAQVLIVTCEVDAGR